MLYLLNNSNQPSKKIILQMISQYIKNRFSKELLERDTDILSCIKNPTSVSKEECPLWKFVTILEGKEHKRSSSNFDLVLAVEIDFDGNNSIEEFKEKYKGIEFYLYTTSSHVKNSVDKFRCIIPLNVPFKFSRYSDKIFLQCLSEFFKGVDPTSFKNFQNCPNAPVDKVQDYEWYYNSGELFDIDVFSEKYEFLSKRHEREVKFKDMQKDIKKKTFKGMGERQKLSYKKKVEENIMKSMKDIPTHKTGNRYSMLLTLAGKLVHSIYPDDSYVFSDEEVFGIITSHTDDTRVRHMLRDFINIRGGV